MALSPLAAMEKSCTGELWAGRTAQGFVLRVLRRGSIHESLPLAQFASNCLTRGLDLTIDLSQCRLADSTFVGALIVLHKRSRSSERGQFRIHAPEGYAARLLESMQLHRFLVFEEELPPVVGEWMEIPRIEEKPLECKVHALDSHRELASIEGPDRDLFADIVDRLSRDLNASVKDHAD